MELQTDYNKQKEQNALELYEANQLSIHHTTQIGEHEKTEQLAQINFHSCEKQSILNQVQFNICEC